MFLFSSRKLLLEQFEIVFFPRGCKLSPVNYCPRKLPSPQAHTDTKLMNVSGCRGADSGSACKVERLYRNSAIFPHLGPVGPGLNPLILSAVWKVSERSSVHIVRSETQLSKAFRLVKNLL